MIDKIVIKDSDTVFSFEAVIKEREAVKFKDGDWIIKGKVITFLDQRVKILTKLKRMGICDVKDNFVTIRAHNDTQKKYSFYNPTEFEKLMTILEFMGDIDICQIYEILGVSTSKNTGNDYEVIKGHFFEGEEKEMIEWAVKNKLWKYLKEVAL